MIPLLFSEFEDATEARPSVLTVLVHLNADGRVTGFDLKPIAGREKDAALVAYRLAAENVAVLKIVAEVRKSKPGKPRG